MKYRRRNSIAPRVKVSFTRPSRAKQSFKDECDINTIMRKWQKNGLVAHVNEHQGQYADVSDVADYQASLGIVKEAQETFLSLPSSIRKKFDNDPAAFLQFVQDPKNLEEMYELGLAKRPPMDSMPESPATPPSAPPDSASEGGVASGETG